MSRDVSIYNRLDSFFKDYIFNADTLPNSDNPKIKEWQEKVFDAKYLLREKFSASHINYSEAYIEIQKTYNKLIKEYNKLFGQKMPTINRSKIAEMINMKEDTFQNIIRKNTLTRELWVKICIAIHLDKPISFEIIDKGPVKTADEIKNSMRLIDRFISLGIAAFNAFEASVSPAVS